MKLYNTLTRRVEEFKPLQDKKVKLFVCGPTVYDFAHIGNAKTYIQMDTLARTLRASGYDVFYLENITDIDDKIIVRAQEQGISWEELRTKYETEFLKDMKTLNNTSVTTYARATDYIENIVKQVQTLLDTGHAYKIEDGIYFEVATFADYGKLSGRTDVQKDDAQTRIDHSAEKKGWNDFCLWKFSKPDEPVWDAPFGQGRPGWHIEDTAISEHFFGPQYDVHGGAVDLIFPHHEAEITQMESISGKAPFVKYWVHAGFLNVDGAKMSKSLKNFYTIRDVIEKGYEPLALRLLALQSHYRSQSNFTWDNLQAAQNRLQDFRAFADLQFQANENTAALGSTYFADQRTALLEAMGEDLNTPQALVILNEVIERITGDAGGLGDMHLTQFKDFLTYTDELLGLGLAERTDISRDQKQLIKKRQQARDNNEWSEADKLRNKLSEHGLGVRDTAQGPVWFRLDS